MGPLNFYGSWCGAPAAPPHVGPAEDFRIFADSISKEDYGICDKCQKLRNSRLPGLYEFLLADNVELFVADPWRLALQFSS